MNTDEHGFMTVSVSTAHDEWFLHLHLLTTAP
jgi:hypothetical protein